MASDFVTRARSTQEHRLEISSEFFADGWTAECSCGWCSEEMATQDAALMKGREHIEAWGSHDV